MKTLVLHGNGTAPKALTAVYDPYVPTNEVHWFACYPDYVFCGNGCEELLKTIQPPVVSQPQQVINMLEKLNAGPSSTEAITKP